MIDYYTYAQKKDLEYEPWSYHQITVADIQNIANECAIEFRTGDILLLRTGIETFTAIGCVLTHIM